MSDKMPKDPHILCSYVNMNLRDRFGSLEDFCAYEDADMDELKGKLEKAGYVYDAKENRFQ